MYTRLYRVQGVAFECRVMGLGFRNQLYVGVGPFEAFLGICRFQGVGCWVPGFGCIGAREKISLYRVEGLASVWGGGV